MKTFVLALAAVAVHGFGKMPEPIDECGVPGGFGIPEGQCDCYGSVDDECGMCGGSGIMAGTCDCAGSVVDECGMCGGMGIPEGQCDCAGSVNDECGMCGVSGIMLGTCDCAGSVEDECGMCGGSGIMAGMCDCAGSVLDECGMCGGMGIPKEQCDCAGSVNDECGVCGGSGIPEGQCDCAGSVNDECGVCGGSGIPEGICDCAGAPCTGAAFIPAGTCSYTPDGGKDYTFEVNQGEDTEITSIPIGKKNVLIKLFTDNDNTDIDMKVIIGSTSWSYSSFDGEEITIGSGNVFAGCADSCNLGKTYTRDADNGGGTVTLGGDSSMGKEWIYVAETFDVIDLQVNGYSGGFSTGTVTVWWDCDASTCDQPSCTLYE